MMRFNTIQKFVLLSAVILSGYTAKAQSFSVDINMAPEQMIQNLVGTGVQISNVVVTACDSTYGYYTSVGTELGSSEGLLLTTGKALNAIGPTNTGGNCDYPGGIPCDYYDNNCPGSPLLNAQQDYATRDATMIEFDIIPQGDSLKFKYTFASEEYIEWVNSDYNDAFGFFISGPNVGTDVNLAVLPTTSEIVSVNSVNHLENTEFFFDNRFAPYGQFIQYDGFTIGLEAKVGNLIPCAVYHLKLVIADGSDRTWDSGVLINAIESNPIVVLTATSNGLDYMVEGCNTGTITFTREFATSSPQDVTFYVGGTASNGVDYTPQIGSGIPLDANSITIPANATSVSFDIEAAQDNLAEGQEYITIYLDNPLCIGNQFIDSVNFYINDSLDLNISATDTDICFGQCTDLTGVSNVIGLADFVWTGDVSNPLSLNVEVCPEETTTYSLTATVGECSASDEITINVSSISVELLPTDINCEGGSTGSIAANVLGAVEPLAYAWTGPDGFTSSDATPTGLAPGIYCVTVTDAAGCIAEACDTLVQVNELTATAELSDYNCSMISCNGACDGSINITLDGGVFPFTYEWSGPSGFEWFFMDASNLCAGTYTFTVTDAVGCQYTNSYTLLEPDSVELSVVGTVDLLCTGFETGEASVSATGGCSPYTYSWSHDATVTGPVATDLGSGTYNVSVTDQNNCTNDGTVTIVINDPIAPLTVTVDEISVYPGGFGVSCPGAEDGYINITIASGLPPYTVTWISESDNTVFSTSEDLVDAPCGLYTLSVVDANDCPYSQTLQITCVPAITVTYDVTNNPCGAPDVAGGAIDVTSTLGGQGSPYTYEWSGPSCPCSTASISGLNSGDYVLTVTDALGCQTTITANIGQNDAFEATGVVTDNQCADSCNGAIDITVTDAGSTGGPADFILNGSSEIQVCFTGTHSWVSDLAFHLVGPPGCGSPDVLLSPNPGSVGEGNTCNNGDNISNLCFFTESTNNLDVCAGTPFTLSGTYGSYSNAFTPINWTPLNGCNVSEPGWSVQVYDCVGGDFGALTDATMTFNGTDVNGDPVNRVYSTPVGFSSPINDNSCSSASASIFYVDQDIIGGGGGSTGTYTYTWSGPFTGTPPTTQDVSGLCPGHYTVTISSGDCIETLEFDLIDPTGLEIVPVSIVNPVCFGQNNGSIDIDVVGGSGDYSYSWTSSLFCVFTPPASTVQDLTNLFECGYTVHVTDNITGCEVEQFFLLDAPQVMDIVVVTSEFDGGYNISCIGANDGSISVFVTGGTPDCTLFAPYCYQYDWITDCSEIDPAVYGNDPNAPSGEGLPGGTYGINVTDANGCLATTCLDLLEPDSIQSPALIQNIDCNSTSGCITPGLTGGTGLYIVYEWTGDIGSNSPDAATLCDLPAGPYSLTVTDSNNCQNTFDYVIEETPPMTATLVSTTDASCYGVCDGSVTVVVEGGEAPIMCYLDGEPLGNDNSGEITVTDLCAGDYIMTHEDAGGCTAEVSFTINQPDSLHIDLQAILQEATQIYSIQCVGDSTGAIDASVSGGTLPYSFTWTDEALNIIGTSEDIASLSAGTYCLNVMDDNGCTQQACFEITEPDSVLEASGIVSIYNEVFNVSCFDATDGTIDITVVGGVAPYTFNWNGDGTIETDEDQTGLGAGIYEVLVTDANFCTVLLSFELLEPTPIVADATLSLFDGGFNVSCSGVCDGSISLDLSGGAGGYSVVWSGPNGYTSTDENISELCAGTYNATITDANNCAISVSYVITAPQTLTVEITQDYNCANGTVELCAVVTGGSGTYTFSWTTGETTNCITADADGNICVDVVDSNGCSATVCVDVVVNDPLVVLSNVVDATCGLCNGAINITISGGVPPYTILWQDGPNSEDRTDLCAGTYVVTITDATGCSQSISFTIQNAPGVTVNTEHTDAKCFGESTGTATATTVGGTPAITFLWEDQNGNDLGTGASISDLGIGIYTVTATDAAGCFDTEQVTIGQPTALDLVAEVSIFGNYNISGPDGSDGAIEVIASGGVPAYTYQWSPIDVSNDQNSVDGLTAGDYTVVVYDANGCKVDTTFTLTAPSDIKLYTALSPNGDGFNDTYVIDGVLSCKGNQFKVFNRWGNLVYEKSNYQNEWYGQSTDGGTLADGTYFVVFEGCSKEFNTYVDLRRE